MQFTACRSTLNPALMFEDKNFYRCQQLAYWALDAVEGRKLSGGTTPTTPPPPPHHQRDASHHDHGYHRLVDHRSTDRKRGQRQPKYHRPASSSPVPARARILKVLALRHRCCQRHVPDQTPATVDHQLVTQTATAWPTSDGHQSMESPLDLQDNSPRGLEHTVWLELWLRPDRHDRQQIPA